MDAAGGSKTANVPPRHGHVDRRLHRRHRAEHRPLPDVDTRRLLRELPHRPQLLQRRQGREPADATSRAAGSNATNTDFIARGTYGICVTCHARRAPKDNANQAGDGRLHGCRPSRVPTTRARPTSTPRRHLRRGARRRLPRQLLEVPQRREDQGLPAVDAPVRHALSAPSATSWPARRHAHRPARRGAAATAATPALRPANDYLGVAPMIRRWRVATSDPVHGRCRRSIRSSRTRPESVVACVNCHNPHDASATATRCPTRTTRTTRSLLHLAKRRDLLPALPRRRRAQRAARSRRACVVRPRW